MTFLDTILVGQTTRKAGERWQHSTSTISKNCREVMDCMLLSKDEIIAGVKEDEETSPFIASNYRFFPYFKDCIGALDGTLIGAICSPEDHEACRDRHDALSQNVLGVIRFNMIWSYVLAGWEGSAHDGKVLADALCKGLTTFHGKYYLGDAGYALTEYCLTPYRGVRYHLKEWKKNNEAPVNPKELFNLRHSSLRNVIERGYGVLKKRFPVLRNMQSYDFRTQRDIVVCCFIVQNFIRTHKLQDDEFDILTEEELGRENNNDEGICEEPVRNQARSKALNKWRDDIAEAMWRDYEAELLNRRDL